MTENVFLGGHATDHIHDCRHGPAPQTSFNIKLFGYLFFALHIFALGYAVFKSQYIPKSLGLLLVVASFGYIVFFVDFHLTKTFEVIIMSTMAIAELSLSIWLIVKRNRLPEH